MICAKGNPPEWAVTNACRWWIGPDNADRKRRPQAGDIASRIKWELGAVAMGEVRVSSFRPSNSEVRDPRSDKEIQRMAEAGQRAIDALKAKAGQR